ncbi:MAG: lysine biosynthesis protein LysX [Nitrososphaerota archaeon]
MAVHPSLEIVYDVPRIEEKLLVKAAKLGGLTVRLTNVRQQPLIFDKPAVDVSLVRCISMYNAVHSAAVREGAGVKAIKSSDAIIYSGNKILSGAKLRASTLPIPRTAVGLDAESAEKALENIGLPAVDKPPIGSWGRLVALVKDELTFKTLLEHREMIPSSIMRTHVIQEYIDLPNRDVRTLVIGDDVLGAVFRYRGDGDWRTNVARGGTPVTAFLNEELKEISIKTAKAIGGDVVSVDIFETSDGSYLVNEINGVPEFKGLMQATGIDVAAKVIEYVAEVMRR